MQDIVSRYSFKDLWPCSSTALDYLSRQEVLVRNMNKKIEKSTPGVETDGSMPGVSSNTNSAKFVRPDPSKMAIYNPKQTPGTLPYSGIQLNSNGGQPPNVLGDVLKSLPPAMAAFISNLPAVEGPSPNTDFVISVCLQSNIPSVIGKPGAVSHPAQSGSVPSTSDLSDSSKFKTRDRLSGKRKNMDSMFTTPIFLLYMS
nr:cleavage stimulation factor subunit 77 isoform X1 [Ipomoea batatas]